MNPFSDVVVRNTDADEAGDYAVTKRWRVWFGFWSGWVLCPHIAPADLD